MQNYLRSNELHAPSFRAFDTFLCPLPQSFRLQPLTHFFVHFLNPFGYSLKSALVTEFYTFLILSLSCGRPKGASYRGRPFGIPALFCRACRTHFVQTCCTRGRPMVYAGKWDEFNTGDARVTDLESLGIPEFLPPHASVEAAAYNAANDTRKNYTTFDPYPRKTLVRPKHKSTRASYIKLNVNITRASDETVISNDMLYVIATDNNIYGLRDQRTMRFLEELAQNVIYYASPTAQSITVSPDQVFHVQRYNKDDWKDSTRFKADETVRFSILLPPRVVFNDFILEIKTENNVTPIEVRTFNYSGAETIIEYDGNTLLQLSNGNNKFTAKLMKDGLTISTLKFKISASVQKSSQKLGIPI